MPSVIDIQSHSVPILEAYDEKIESYYHNPEIMKSIIVLEKEKELVDFIIQYKKCKNLEFHEFLQKKRRVEKKISDLTIELDKGILENENYEKLIHNEINHENELINILEVDKSIENKSSDINRIKKRIRILEQELAQIKLVQDDKKKTSDIDIKLDIGQNEQQIPHISKKEIINSIKFKSSKKSLKFKKINLENEKEFLEKLYALKEDYDEATNYFKNLGYVPQAEDSLSISEILSDLISKIENNKMTLQEIENIMLPDPASLEYISGYSKEDRQDIFTKIIRSLIIKRQDYIAEYLREKEKYDVFQESISSSLKKEEISQNLEQIELKFYECVKTMHNLNQMLNDPWTPPPVIKFTEELKRVEKVKEEIPPYAISMSIGALKYKSSDIFLQIHFRYSDMHILDEYINQNGDNEFDYNVLLKLSKYDYFNLYEKSIYVTLLRKNSAWSPCCPFFGNNLLGDLEIKLEELKYKSEIKGEFELHLIENLGRRDYEEPFLNSTLEVSIKIRRSMIEKEFESFVTNTLEVVKYLPPFKGIGKYFHPDFKSSYIIDINQDDLDKIDRQELAIYVPIENPKQNQMIINPSEYTEKELDNPDNIENLNSINVLIQKIKCYKLKLKNCENENERNLLNEKIIKIKAKFLNLQDQIKSGNISLDKYILILNNQIQKDSKLMRYLDNLNEKTKAKLVADRIIILSNEISEAVHYYKTIVQ